MRQYEEAHHAYVKTVVFLREWDEEGWERRRTDLESEKKELIGYLRTFDIVLFAMFTVLGIIGLVTVIVVGIPGIMFLIPACIAFINWLGKYNEAAGLVRKFEKEGSLTNVLYDFRNGDRFLNGRLIRGENYIMSMGWARSFARQRSKGCWITERRMGLQVTRGSSGLRCRMERPVISLTSV